MHSPLITAHTGADGTPDNSLEYVRYALTTNADTLEVDIRPIDDGTLVISHDEAGLDAVPLAEVPVPNNTSFVSDINSLPQSRV